MRLRYPVPKECVATLRFGKYPAWLQLMFGRRFHNGIDFALPHYKADREIPITSATPGIVMLSGYNSDAGNFVLVSHRTEQNLVICYYYHLEKDYVFRGKLLRTKDPIGIMGDSGKVTDKHLHFGTALFKLEKLIFIDPAPHFVD